MRSTTTNLKQPIQMTSKQRHNPYSSLPKLLPTNAYTIPDVFIRGVPRHHSNKQNNNLETKSKAKPSINQVPFPLGYQRIQEEENPIRVKNDAINRDALKEASTIHVNIWNTADGVWKQNFPGNNISSKPYFDGILDHQVAMSPKSHLENGSRNQHFIHNLPPYIKPTSSAQQKPWLDKTRTNIYFPTNTQNNPLPDERLSQTKQFPNGLKSPLSRTNEYSLRKIYDITLPSKSPIPANMEMKNIPLFSKSTKKNPSFSISSRMDEISKVLYYKQYANIGRFGTNFSNNQPVNMHADKIRRLQAENNILKKILGHFIQPAVTGTVMPKDEKPKTPTVLKFKNENNYNNKFIIPNIPTAGMTKKLKIRYFKANKHVKGPFSMFKEFGSLSELKAALRNDPTYITRMQGLYNLKKSTRLGRDMKYEDFQQI